MILLPLSPAAVALPALSGPPVQVVYIERRIDRPPPLNNEDPVPEDEGLAGARLGLKDSNATGRFVGVALALSSRGRRTGHRYPEDLYRHAHQGAGETDFRRRECAGGRSPRHRRPARGARHAGLQHIGAGRPAEGRRLAAANILHVAASRSMLTDAARAVPALQAMDADPARQRAAMTATRPMQQPCATAPGSSAPGSLGRRPMTR